MDHITTFTLPDSGPSFDMVRVPGGTFVMGSPKDEPERSDDEMQHPVEVSGFSMGKFLVTQELWTAVLGSNPSRFKGDLLPVEQVSWFDAAVFCNALSTMLGRNPCYVNVGKNIQPFGWNTGKQQWDLLNAGEVVCDFKANGFRLPTEAEWEYAARGGPFAPALQPSSQKDYLYAGSDQLEQVGWFVGNNGKQTQEVGLLLPNALGLYDMSGNVFEWCHDWYGNYEKRTVPDPRGAERGPYRVFRGGNWNYYSQSCRVACRNFFEPAGRSNFIGLRLVFQ